MLGLWEGGRRRAGYGGRKGLGMPLLIAACSAFFLPGAVLLFHSAYLTLWCWSQCNLWCAVARAALSPPLMTRLNVPLIILSSQSVCFSAQHWFSLPAGN